MADKKSLGLLALAGVEPYVEGTDEEYMSDEQLAHFTKILEAWRKQLREEVDRTMTHMQDEAANFPDPVDRASQEEEFALELRTRDRERKLIKKIEKTLVLVENDDFGFCKTCGIEIGIRRLEARPTADQCIDCKTLSEIKEKQSQVEKYPNDLDLKIELSQLLNDAGRKEEALETLFSVLKRDLNFNDAKASFLAIIASLPDGDALAAKYRRKLYSILY